MSMIFILIQIKFNIDINNNELLKTIWEHKKRKRFSWLSLVVCSTVKSKLTIGQTRIQATMVKMLFWQFCVIAQVVMIHKKILAKFDYNLNIKSKNIKKHI